jgi:hypothetical protein
MDFTDDIWIELQDMRRLSPKLNNIRYAAEHTSKDRWFLST